MRRLTEIHAAGEGVKGRAFDIALSGADLLAGPNKTGKSTVLLAVPIGLRGLSAAPLNPKEGADGRVYLGPAKLDTEITLVFDDGQRIVRDLSKPKGQEAARAAADADRLVGPHLVRYDLADFAGTTDSVRARLLEQACAAGAAAGGVTPAMMAAKVRDRLGLAPPPERADDASTPVGRSASLFSVTTGVPDPPKPEHVFTGFLRACPPAGAPSTWLAKALEVTAKVFADANADQKATASAAADKAADVSRETPTGNLIQARHRLAQAEEKRRVLGERMSARKAYSGLRATREAAERRLVEAATRAESVRVTVESTLERLRAAPDPADLPALDAALEEAEALLTPGRSAVDRAQKVLLTAAQAKEQAIAALNRAKSRLSTLQGISGDGLVCQHCGAEEPLDLTRLVADAQATVEAAQDASDDAEVDHTLATVDLRTASDALDMLTQARDDARVARQAGIAEVVKAEEALAAAEKDAVEAARAVEEANAALLAHRAAADASEEPDAGDVGDDEATEAQRLALDAEIKETKAIVEGHVRHAERTKAMQEAVAKREAALTRFEQVKALKAALLEVQDELARDAYIPLRDAANDLLGRASVSEAVYLVDASDFGATILVPDGTVNVPYASLSDSEKALVGCALAYAFAALSGSPWPAVLLDNLDAIDAERRPGVLQALAEMVQEGKIANFIGTMWCNNQDALPAIDGLTVTWTGEE